jgi:hypothetical protein
MAVAGLSLMKVESEIFTHPKFVRFRKMVGAGALEYLCKLWGHCEPTQRGEHWKNADAEYVEAICGWESDKNLLFDSLKVCGWIKREKRGVRICGWEEHNWRRVSNWYIGKKGGRPKKTQGKPNDNPRVSVGKPNDNPTQTPSELIGTEMIGNEYKEGGSADPTPQLAFSTSGTGNHPGTIPPDGEVLNFAVKWPGEPASGTPKMPIEFVREWLAKMNGRTVGWPLQWDRALISEWRSKHATWGKKRVNGSKNGAPNILDLKTQLQAIDRRLVTHPANEESATFGGQCSAEEHADFENLLKMKGEIERKLRGEDEE